MQEKIEKSFEQLFLKFPFLSEKIVFERKDAISIDCMEDDYTSQFTTEHWQQIYNAIVDSNIKKLSLCQILDTRNEQFDFFLDTFEDISNKIDAIDFKDNLISWLPIERLKKLGKLFSNVETLSIPELAYCSKEHIQILSDGLKTVKVLDVYPLTLTIFSLEQIQELGSILVSGKIQALLIDVGFMDPTFHKLPRLSQRYEAWCDVIENTPVSKVTTSMDKNQEDFFALLVNAGIKPDRLETILLNNRQQFIQESALRYYFFNQVNASRNENTLPNELVLTIGQKLRHIYNIY